MRIKSLLRQYAEWSKYFWNYLFIVLYDPERKRINVTGLSMKVGYSESRLHDFLGCNAPISEEVFYQLCEAIGLDVDKCWEYVKKSADMAMRLIFDSRDTDKLLSKSSKKRSERIKQLSVYQDEQYDAEEERMLRNEEAFENAILAEFEGLSAQELTCLYRAVDILPPTFYGHVEEFLRVYLELNDTGRALYREALEGQKTDSTDRYQDEMVVFLQKLSADEKKEVMPEITPQILSDKLSQNCPGYWEWDFARTMALFLKLDAEAWETLILLHRIIQENQDEKIQDVVDFRDSVLLLLDWLWHMPSLIKDND